VEDTGKAEVAELTEETVAVAPLPVQSGS